MSDLIRREDAVEALRMTIAQYIPYLIGINESLPLNCEIALCSVPSADRPQGKWIKNYFGMVICSECKCPRRDNRVGHTTFCNACGARMKGADDEDI